MKDFIYLDHWFFLFTKNSVFALFYQGELFYWGKNAEIAQAEFEFETADVKDEKQ